MRVHHLARLRAAGVAVIPAIFLTVSASCGEESDPIGPPVAGAGQAADMHGSIDAFHQMSKAKEAAGESLADRLHQYDGPVRLLVGTVAHPAEVPHDQRALLREQLADFRSDSVPGSGQYIHEEQPSVVVEAVAGLDQAAR